MVRVCELADRWDVVRGPRDVDQRRLQRARRDRRGSLRQHREEERERMRADAQRAANEQDGDQARANRLELGEAERVSSTGRPAREAPRKKDDEIAQEVAERMARISEQRRRIHGPPRRALRTCKEDICTESYERYATASIASFLKRFNQPAAMSVIMIAMSVRV